MLSDLALQRVVSEIVKDICDRKRLGPAWEETSSDAKEDIIETWKRIIRTHEEREE